MLFFYFIVLYKKKIWFSFLNCFIFVIPGPFVANALNNKTSNSVTQMTLVAFFFCKTGYCMVSFLYLFWINVNLAVSLVIRIVNSIYFKLKLGDVLWTKWIDLKNSFIFPSVCRFCFVIQVHFNLIWFNKH